jgi:exonuclease III
MDPLRHPFKFLTWHVRGLNSVARQDDVKQVISLHKPNLVCLQETKIQDVTTATIRNSLGMDYQDSFVFLPAAGTSGGIILVVNSSVLQLSSPSTTSHTISASVLDLRRSKSWMVIGVYGPQSDLDKKMFIRELRLLK